MKDKLIADLLRLRAELDVRWEDARQRGVDSGAVDAAFYDRYAWDCMGYDNHTRVLHALALLGVSD